MLATTDRRLLTPRTWALLAAVAVFVLGFGVLNVLSWLDLADSGLPGLYTYRSASVGDGLLLPLLAYALVRSAGLHLGWSRRERRGILIAGSVGAAIGVGSQAYWLLNPRPDLNWTLPTPHTFNVAGWYHAGFLVAACAFFAAAGAALWLRVRAEATSGTPWLSARLRSIGAVAVIFPPIAFAVLLALDNHLVVEGPSVSPGSLATLIVVTLALLAAAMAAVGRTHQGTVWTLFSAAVVPAVAAGGLLVPGARATVTVVVAAWSAAFAGLFAWSVAPAQSLTERVAGAGLVALSAAGPVYAVLSRAEVGVVGVALACFLCLTTTVIEVLALRALVSDSAAGLWRPLLMCVAGQPAVAFAASARYFDTHPDASASSAGAVGYLAGTAFLAVSAWGLRTQFDPVITAEVEGVPVRDLAALKWGAYMAFVGMYSAALLAFLSFAAVTIPTKNWVAGSDGSSGALVVLGAVLALTLVALWWVGTRSGTTSIVLAAAGCVVWCGAVAWQLTAGPGDWKQGALSILAAIVCGLFVVEGIVSNTAYLHNLAVDWRARLVGFAAGAAVALTVAWFTGPGLYSRIAVQSVGLALGGLAIGAIACCLVPFLAARTLPGASPPRVYTTATPLAGVLQDSFLITLVGISVAWVPNFFLAHVRNLNIWSANVFFYLTLLGAAYLYVMRNNVGHVARERERLDRLARSRNETPSAVERQALARLAQHVERQNRLAFVALVPLGLLALFYIVTGFDREGLPHLMRVPRS